MNKRDLISPEAKKYFLKFLNREKTKKQISDLRLKLEIPKEGFPGPSKEDLAGPNLFLSCDQWKYDNSEIDTKLGKDLQFSEGIESIMEGFELQSLYWKIVFRIYLFHNKAIFNLPYIPTGPIFADLCIVDNFKETLDEIKDVPFVYKSHFEGELQRSRNYPVVLYIHGHAEQNDITRFIRRNWDYIKLMQLQAGFKEELNSIKLSQRGSINVANRDAFIYEIRHLSRKEAAERVFKKYKVHLSPKHISVIRNREAKKRKDNNTR